MLDFIQGTAMRDDRIRAALMNGSRTNPNAKQDIFQDYDIVYVVRDIDSFTSDHRWVDRFGDRIMMQMPEDKVLPPAANNGAFVYLMQFTDGNRIDLTLIPQEKKDELLKPDSLCQLLLDKDGLIGPLPPSSDRDYRIQRPTERQFMDQCNEFWWICMNIAKGLWREELPYAMFMYEQVNRGVLIRMLEWHIGIQTDFTRSAGKFGKYFKDFLEEDEWNDFVATYTDADYANIWKALFVMCDLFRKTATNVASHFGFPYPYEDDSNVTAHLRHIKHLPRNAATMYP